MFDTVSKDEISIGTTMLYNNSYKASVAGNNGHPLLTHLESDKCQLGGPADLGWDGSYI